MKKKLPLLFILSAFLLFLFSISSKSFMKECLLNSYYLLLLLFFSWIAILIKTLRNNNFSWKKIKRLHILGSIFCLLLTTAIFIAVKPNFRVLDDESDLLGVSQGMLHERTTNNTVMANWYFGNLNPIKQDLEKRPFLFPFFTYVIHSFDGYRAFNAFILNFLTFFSLFLLVFILIEESFGTAPAFAAVFLIAAQPIVTLSATSGGFDLFAVLFIFIAFASLKAFLRTPSSSRFEFLWVNLLMLSHIRYESFLFFALTLLLLFAFNYVQKDYFQASWIYSLTPLLMLPLFWQAIVTPSKELLGTYMPGVPPNTFPFGLNFLINHVSEFVRSLFYFDFHLPYATLINLLGMIALFYFLRLVLLNQWPHESWKKHLLAISFTCAGVHTLLFFSYYHSQLNQPADGRYFCFFLILLSLLALMMLVRLFSSYQQKSALLLLMACSFFMLYHPIAIQNQFFNALAFTRFYQPIINFFQNRENSNFRIITDSPWYYTGRNYGAVSFELANFNTDRILEELKNHLYTDIFVIQNIQSKTSTSSSSTLLDPKFSLQTLYELQVMEPYFIRISRVKNFDRSATQ